MSVHIHIAEKQTTSTLIFPLYQSEALPSLLNQVAIEFQLDSEALQQDFKAEHKESLLIYLPQQPARRLYLLGLGKKNHFAEVHHAFRSFCFKHKNRLPQWVSIHLHHFEADERLWVTDAAVSGMLLGLYPNRTAENEDNAKPTFAQTGAGIELLVPGQETAPVQQMAFRSQQLAEVQWLIFDLMNKPSNHKTPEILADLSKKWAKKYGFSVRVLLREDIIEVGLHALLSVNQGSPHSPAFLILEYAPPNFDATHTPTVGLVGKGVTFDTGGISIKPSANMHLMKSDLGGAAAVLGAFMTCAALQLPIRLVGTIPATENMVDGKATKPGDVIGTYLGKTIEVIDTDAEGRIILADGLGWLVRNFKTDVLIDLATLTGSIVRALGNVAAGVFTQNDHLLAHLDAASHACGERIWRMPLWDEYATDLKSDVADLKNYTGKGHSDACNAAKFLENFTENHPAWAHLDIAGVAFTDSEFASGKSATAFGVRLLVTFFEKLIQSVKLN